MKFYIKSVSDLTEQVCYTYLWGSNYELYFPSVFFLCIIISAKFSYCISVVNVINFYLELFSPQFKTSVGL